MTTRKKDLKSIRRESRSCMAGNILHILLVICMALAAIPTRTTAQNGTYYNADKHLTSCFVNNIYQDKNGFIWIATRNGLNRYDGYNFRIYKKGMPGCDNIKSNVINCVSQSIDNILYIGMFGGAQALYNDSFYDIALHDDYGNNVTDYVTCITACQDKSVIIGTSGNGLFRISPSDIHINSKGEPKLTAHMQKIPALSAQQGMKAKTSKTQKLTGILKVYQSSDGTLWIITSQDGLYAVKGNATRHFFSDSKQKTSVMDICQDKNSNIYIAMHGQGLYTMKPWQQEPQHIAETGNAQISAVTATHDGRIIIGLDGSGIDIYTPSTHSIVHNPYYHKEFNLSHAKVNSIVEDKNGNLWFGLLQKGVFMQPVRTMNFRYMGYKQGEANRIGDCCITSIHFTADNHLWIGTDKDGIYHADASRNVIGHIGEGKMPTTVMSMCSIGDRLWAGSYLRGAGSVSNGSYTPIDFKMPYSVSIFSMDTDKDGNLWLATMGQGIIKYSPKDATSTVINCDAARAADDSLANVLANAYVMSVDVSPDGKRLYAATTMGLCCLDLQKNSWTSTFNRNVILFGTPIRCVREITADDIKRDRTKGNSQIESEIWFGSNDGLYIYGLKTRKLTHLTPADGLSSEGIAAIQSDMKGGVWVSTMHGLNRISARTKRVTHRYYVEDGLQSNEFSDGAADIAPDGTIAFGGVSGITLFSPEDISPKPWKATIYLTDIKVNGRSISAGEKSGSYTITEVIPFISETFDLASDDNNITLEFSTLTYDACEHITYKYSINGDKWTELQAGTNEISLSRLPSGTYDFRIIAVKDGQESQEKHVTINIHSPWYATTLAYMIYLILIASAVIYIVNQRRLRMHGAMERRMEDMRRAHAEEMQESKIRFFMNISHEIRTPMSLIVSPIQSLLQNDHDPQRLALYNTIKRNADRILNLINQIMDLRKIEKEQMPMHFEKTEMVGFISEIYQLFEYQAKAKSIAFSFVHSDRELEACIDHSNFDKILVNLLSNAFKFTKPGGKVTISLEGDEDYMTIIVHDTGVGIPPEMMPHIFRRFYSASPDKETHLTAGTGIGLDLTHQLVTLHHGDIKAQNNTDGPGCHFTIIIPRGDIHTAYSEEGTTKETQPTATDGKTPLPTATAATQNEAPQEPAHTEKETPQTAETKPETAETGDRKQKAKPEAKGQKQPKNRKESEAAAPAKPSAQPKATPKQHIAIVEDDTEIREYLAEQLSTHCTISAYHNGKEALAGILSNVPSLVISDIMMPEMDGMTLCSKLKNNINTNHIPIILLTAKDTEEDRMQGLGIGADAYICKPFNLDILKQTVINLMTSRNVMKVKYTGQEDHDDEVDDINIVSADDKLMKRVLKVVNANLSNSDLTVDTIAQEVGLSRVHLYRKMKELTNQSPHQFIRNLRVKKAAKLLSSNRHKVNEVMYACGFSTPTAFNTAFKAVYGVSPREYMKKLDQQ